MIRKRKRVLVVHNSNHLPVMDFHLFEDFQKDFKNPMTKQALDKLKNSLINFGVFVPKFIWFDSSGVPRLIDGHQTKQALLSLENDGWVISHIPYLTIEAKDEKDAIDKLFQINSRYAQINTKSEWINSISNVSEILQRSFIPDLEVVLNEKRYENHKERIKGGAGMEPVDQAKIWGDILEPQGFIPECVIPTETNIKDYPSNYKVDFGHPEKRIAVELDGDYHKRRVQRSKDRKKDVRLQELGWTVFRIIHN